MANRQEEEIRLQMFTCTTTFNPQQRPHPVTRPKKVNPRDEPAYNNLRRRFALGKSVNTQTVYYIIVSDPNALCCFRGVVFA